MVYINVTQRIRHRDMSQNIIIIIRKCFPENNVFYFVKIAHSSAEIRLIE